MATIGVAENAASVGSSTMGSQANEPALDRAYRRLQIEQLDLENQACFK